MKARNERNLWAMCILIAASFLIVSYGEVVAQEQSGLLPLPEFTDCQSTDHPLLPEKWEAAALLQDFVKPSLLFAKFVYDESAQAFRFTLSDRYGTDLDFLVTEDRRLYLLTGGEEPTGCTFETASSPFTVPTRDWLNDRAECVGEAPILEKNQAWWKTPRGKGADWIWYNTSNRLPFRTMYYEAPKITDLVPIYEYFTFNYFPTFQKVPSTNLSKIVSLCEQSGDTPTPSRSWDMLDAHALTADNTYPTPSAEPLAQAQKWIPEIRECSSPGDLPPRWPDQVQGTVFMTAVSFEPNPFPTRVFYDWTVKAQNTSLYYYPPTDINYVQIALLTGDIGYIRIENKSGHISICEQALPGPQVPNWNEVDGCKALVEIAPKSTLNPSDVPTKILWCPTDLSANQVFWTWYSDKGTPVVFMQTNSSPTAGTGLNLADYYEWSPGSVAPPGTYDIPEACQDTPKKPVPQACHNLGRKTRRKFLNVSA